MEFKKLAFDAGSILSFPIQDLLWISQYYSKISKTVLIGSSKKDIYEYLIDKCNPVIKHVPGKYIAEFKCLHHIIYPNLPGSIKLIQE